MGLINSVYELLLHLAAGYTLPWVPSVWKRYAVLRICHSLSSSAKEEKTETKRWDTYTLKLSQLGGRSRWEGVSPHPFLPSPGGQGRGRVLTGRKNWNQTAAWYSLWMLWEDTVFFRDRVEAADLKFVNDGVAARKQEEQWRDHQQSPPESVCDGRPQSSPGNKEPNVPANSFLSSSSWILRRIRSCSKASMYFE